MVLCFTAALKYLGCKYHRGCRNANSIWSLNKHGLFSLCNVYILHSTREVGHCAHVFLQLCCITLEPPCVCFFRGALDHIIVMTKDGKFPLNQLGQISLKSPQLIVVNMASFPEVRTHYPRHCKGRSLPPEQTGWCWASPAEAHTDSAGQPCR